MLKYKFCYRLIILHLFSFFLFPYSVFSQASPAILSWEQDIRALEKRDSLETDPDGAILFTGSSSIRLWDDIAEDMAPWKVIQRGYGGAKLDDFEYYAKRIIYPHRFAAIVLFIANDITGSPDDKKPEEVAFLFTKVLSTIREKYPETPVFWIQVTPTPLRWNSWQQVQQSTNLIRQICHNDKACFLIRTEQGFLGADGNPRPELFRDDRLHLNEKGYHIWAEIIKESLQLHLKNISK